MVRTSAKSTQWRSSEELEAPFKKDLTTGWIVSLEKCMLDPAHVFELLGMKVDLLGYRFTVPMRKLAELKEAMQEVLRRHM